MAIKWVEKLKSKWGITSNRDFILIMIAFSLAGMMISICRPPLFHLLGIDRKPMWEKTLIYIPLIPPIYWIFLLIWGAILGQFRFFWDFFSKRMVKLGKFLLRLVYRPTR